MLYLLREAFSMALGWRGTASFPWLINQAFSHEAERILCHPATCVQTSSCQTLGATRADDVNLQPSGQV